MTVIDPRPTLNAPDDDPYLWLEDIDGERALNWVTEQSARTLARFGGPGFEGDRDTLTGIFDRPDKIAWVMRRDKYLYNFWRDAENPRGLWRRTTLAAYLTAKPEWEIVLDVDALAKTEGKDWIWGGASVEPGDVKEPSFACRSVAAMRSCIASTI